MTDVTEPGNSLTVPTDKITQILVKLIVEEQPMSRPWRYRTGPYYCLNKQTTASTIINSFQLTVNTSNKTRGLIQKQKKN